MKLYHAWDILLIHEAYDFSAHMHFQILPIIPPESLYTLTATDISWTGWLPLVTEFSSS